MKQIIAKNRAEAERFVSIGSGQRRAFWQEHGKLFRFERLPGMQPTWSEDAEGLFWSKGVTVAQKIAATSAARALGSLGGSANTKAQNKARAKNGGKGTAESHKKGGRPRTSKT